MKIITGGWYTFYNTHCRMTVDRPSVVLSQKQELAVWRPAPFFCIMTHVTGHIP